MLENRYFFIDQNKRNKTFHTLNMEEVNILKSSQDSELIAKEFDRIFLKLQRIISYSTNKNNEAKSQVEADTNNLLKKFVNYIKWKTLPRKIREEQDCFFFDICRFINFIDWDSYFTKIHNSLPKTTLNQFKDKTIWEQFFQMTYWREWPFESRPDWWNCTYWTLLHYNFFKKLKEAWLDLEIKFFRYKNLDDRIVHFPSMRHTWLIVTFQWKDYLVDKDWIQIPWWEGPIVRKLDPYIGIAQEAKNEAVQNFFENFRHENMKETDKIIFFDNVEDFISHVEKYPSYKRVIFYKKNWENEKVDHMVFWLMKNCINISINDTTYSYYLQDNLLKRNDFPKNIAKHLRFAQDSTWVHPITEEERQQFKERFDLIKDKIDINNLYNHLTEWEKWHSGMTNALWKDKVIIIPDKLYSDITKWNIEWIKFIK